MQYPFHLTEFNAMTDEWSYKQASEWLYAPDHFPSFTRPFLFPFLIGLPRLLGLNYSQTFVAILNFVCWLLIILFLFRATKDLYNEKKAFIITFLFITCVSLHCFLFLVNTELIYAFVIFSHVFCLFQYLKNLNDNWFFGAVWLLGASTTIRPTLIYYVVLLSVIFGVLVILRKMRLKNFIVICLLFLSTIGLQIFNMYRCTKRLKISYISETAWYCYMGAYSINIAKYPNQTFEFYAKQWEKEADLRLQTFFSIGRSRDREDIRHLSEVENAVSMDVKSQLKDNKWGLIVTFFRSLFVNSRSGTQYALFAKNGLNLPFFYLIEHLFLWLSQIQNIINSGLVLIFLPVFLLKRYRKQQNRFDKTLGLALYSWFLAFSIMLFSTIVFTQGDRFHVITVPITLISLALLFSKKTTILPLYTEGER